MSRFQIDANDTLVLFADLQAGIADMPLTIHHSELKKKVSGLARLAKLRSMPVIVTAVKSPDGSDAKIMPEIGDALGVLPTHYRTTADSFQNAAILETIKATGRKTILISGVATEIAVQLPALTGTDLGYRMFVVVDACGGVSERTESAALSRIVQAGASTVSMPTLTGELAGDFREPVGQEETKLLYEMVS